MLEEGGMEMDLGGCWADCQWKRAAFTSLMVGGLLSLFLAVKLAQANRRLKRAEAKLVMCDE